MSLTAAAEASGAVQRVEARPSTIRPAVGLSGLGMAVHLKHMQVTPEQVERFKKAGLKHVRVDITWNATEKVKGEYDWSYYDQRLAVIAAAGIQPILMLGYSNDLYIDNEGQHVPPRTPEQIEAFTKWAVAATQYFAKYNPIMEIWNEPDIMPFWAPKPDVHEYLAMAKPTCKAMREAVPNATILNGGFAYIPNRIHFDGQVYMRTLMADRAFMDCIDAVAFHPYRTVRPETILDDMPFYEELADEAAAAGGAVRRPFVVTEVGYTSFLPKDRPRINDSLKAAYITRLAAVAMMQGFPLLTIYNWRDYGNNMLDKEHRFGVLDFDSNDKPAARALQTLHATLGDMKLERRLEAPKDTFLLLMQGADGSRTVMAWHATGRIDMTFAAEAPVETVTMLGKQRLWKPDDGKITRRLDGKPVYIKLGSGPLPEFQFGEADLD